jgi:anti-sigma regulatory factor (Ser/Thr protein kinase)
VSVEARWTRHLLLSPEPSSAAEARLFVREALEECDLPLLSPDVQLVVGELATNAATHAGTPFTVSIVVDPHRVLVRVRDRSSRMPVVRDVEETVRHADGTTEDGREGGRGLVLVDVLSDFWGVEPRDRDGKTVWAAFTVR